MENASGILAVELSRFRYRYEDLLHCVFVDVDVVDGFVGGVLLSFSVGSRGKHSHDSFGVRRGQFLTLCTELAPCSSNESEYKQGKSIKQLYQ